MYSLENYILIVENVITDKLCSEIFNEYEKAADWRAATVGNTGNANNDIRKCHAINMSDSNVIKNNQETRKKIDDYLYIASSFVLTKYKTHHYNLFGNKKFSKEYLAPEGDSGYILLRYEKNDFYIEHTDHFLQQPRVLSCSFALNDNYEGGEFAFFDRELKYKLPKGSAIVFPSNFMYPHEIMPITSGIRYSIITWFI